MIHEVNLKDPENRIDSNKIALWSLRFGVLSYDGKVEWYRVVGKRMFSKP